MQVPYEIYRAMTEDLPTFVDGRFDFTDAKKVPVINVVCYSNGEILLLKRSSKVSSYAGMWNGVSGYIDEPKSLEEFVLHELGEELSLTAHIDQIKIGEPYEVNDQYIDKTWFVYPVLVTFPQKPNIRVDWEHDDYVWVSPANLNQYNYVKDFNVSVSRALSLLPLSKSLK